MESVSKKGWLMTAAAVVVAAVGAFLCTEACESESRLHQLAQKRHQPSDLDQTLMVMGQ